MDADPEAIVKKTLKGQPFSDSPERVDAFDEWMNRKRQWEASERRVVEALSVFSDLFELRSRFDRESEKYQLYLADGMLVIDQESGRIEHPILIQRVELLFNLAAPEFVIVATDDNPQAYIPLLRHAGLDGQAIQHVTETLADKHYHPLAGEPTSRFLKDFVHRFWTDGEYVEDREEIPNPSGPYIYRQPHLYLGSRNQGLGENIERYLEALPSFRELPESLLRIVGVESDRDAGKANTEAGEPATIDLLLTKPANPEQEQVIQRVEETGAVLVQGPPGTGKSHTIANLIGHFLAQDKSILVTSHASKATARRARPTREAAVAAVCQCSALRRREQQATRGVDHRDRQLPGVDAREKADERNRADYREAQFAEDTARRTVERIVECGQGRVPVHRSPGPEPIAVGIGAPGCRNGQGARVDSRTAGRRLRIAADARGG